MTSVTKNQLQEIYNALGEVLACPGKFGLGESVPQSLAASLRAMRQTLQQALKERQEETAAEDLEAELSQDADSLCHCE
jgi:hypothetical protein